MKFCFESKEFIEHQIEPYRLAVVDDLRELTWLQFEQEVNLICSFFTKYQWDKFNKPVIIYGHKKAEMIVAIYAMMKLKIAYIPLDVIYPKQRISYIQKVSGAEVVLNCSHEPLNLEGTLEVKMEANEFRITGEKTIANSEKIISDDPLVYIIFTSGSTGEPKGVQITTKAIQSFTRWMTNDFGFTNKDVFINIAIFSFDLSVYEVMSFGALGATILLNDRATSDLPDKLMSRIEKYKGTVWVSTPSFALAYTRIGFDPKLSSLKYFLFCGETLPHSIAANLHKSFPSSIIFNTYGPTEATVATTKIEITRKILDAYNPLPVGFPKPESRIIIDKEKEDKNEGELIIIGDHVSIGYLNNPALNQQKFFSIDGQRSYRTGDLGYFENGLLFCKGRNDDQIKMHGYRIELNEISNTIRKLNLISDAVTVGLKKNNEVKKIVSFVILKNEMEKKELFAQLLPFLNKTLPYYMIPGDIDIVKNFHYNSSHKIDKNKLIEEYLDKQLNRI